MRYLRIAFRPLTSEPLQVAAIVVCLSVGLGVGVVVFALLDHILLTPLPYAEPERIVHVWEAWPAEPGQVALGMPYAHYLELMEFSESMESIALYGRRPGSAAVPERGIDTELADVTPKFFATLGVPPVAGRWLDSAGEAVEEPTAVVSRRLWEKLFGLASLDGQTVLINGAAYTVVGIMPAEFAFPTGATDVWLPMPRPKQLLGQFAPCIGRLRSGVSASQAASELARFDLPDEGKEVRVSPLPEHILGDVRRPLILLGGAIAIIFVIALLNASIVQFARINRRWKDFGIRAALGASSRQLALELVTDSLVPALVGGVLGIVVVSSLLGAVVGYWPDEIPRIHTFSVWSAKPLLLLGFAVLASVLAMTGISLWFVRRLRVLGRLNSAFEGAGGSPLRFRLNRVTVSAQLAATLILLISAGTLGRTFLEAASTDLGYSPESVLAARFTLPRDGFPTRARQLAITDSALEALAGIEGVQAAAFASNLPSAAKGETTLGLPDRPELAPQVAFSQVSPGYFKALGLRLLAGESLPEFPFGERVAVINESLSRLYLDSKPLGRTIELSAQRYRVVGVVADVLQEGFGGRAGAGVYVHYLQPPNDSFIFDLRRGFLVLRADGGVTRYFSAFREAVEETDQRIKIEWLRPMDDLVAESVARPKFWMVLTLSLALISLAFSSVAIYAMMSYSVSQRIPELAVRMALGATRPQIHRFVMSGAVAVIGRGLLAGVVISMLVSNLFVDLVLGAVTLHPGVWLVCVALLAACALLAAYLPARRGANTEASECLKSR